MKVTREFAPVTITISSPEELDMFKTMRRVLYNEPKYAMSLFCEKKHRYAKEIEMLNKIINDYPL